MPRFGIDSAKSIVYLDARSYLLIRTQTQYNICICTILNYIRHYRECLQVDLIRFRLHTNEFQMFGTSNLIWRNV